MVSQLNVRRDNGIQNGKKQSQEKELSPEERVELLTTLGDEIACDETTVNLEDWDALPTWYDEQKIKRAQKFFHDHLYPMFFGKLLGLVALLSFEKVAKFLDHTRMSSEPLTAYKRYISTIMYMNIWYKSDFTPGSRLMRSIKEVRCKHFSASKRCNGAQLGRITQKDMAFTQFGFMGFALARPVQIGLHNVAEDDIAALVHLWRLIGHLLGIEDRFNICRESVQETREICTIIVEQQLAPMVKLDTPSFIHMATALIEGMRCLVPALRITWVLFFLRRMCNPAPHNRNYTREEVKSLGLDEETTKFLRLVYGVFYVQQYPFYRKLFNWIHTFAIFLITYFPFLAFYRFGIRNSYVRV